MLDIKPIFNSLRRSKAGAVMLLIQIAITLMIVSNAAFIIKDRLQYLNQETGYPEHEIFTFAVMTYGTDIDLSQKFSENVDMIRNLPGVISASLFSEIPLTGSGSASGFNLDADLKNSKSVRAAYTLTDHQGINALGVEIAEGRNFRADEVLLTQDDSVMPNVVIVSRAFLDEMFPKGDGLGQTIFFGPTPLKVIGVVNKMMGPWLKDRSAENLIIMPKLTSSSFQKVMVRTQAGERSAIMREIEDLLLQDYSKRVIVGLQGLDESKDKYNAGDVLMMRMLLVLIVVLVLVTALGIFGLTVFNINKRTKQIGTRRALGARKSSIVLYFLIENCMICLMGLVLGSIGALYLGHTLLQHYSLPELNKLYIAMTALFVLVISLLSVIFPARKAANISPSVATRSI